MQSISEQLSNLGLVASGSNMPEVIPKRSKTSKGSQKKQQNQASKPQSHTSNSSYFVSPNGDEHTRVASGIAEVKFGKRNKTLDLPNGKTVVQFPVWVHTADKKVAINFFGYHQFSMINETGLMVNAKVEIWEKKTKNGNTFRYVNFYPTESTPNMKLAIGPSDSDDVLIRLLPTK